MGHCISWRSASYTQNELGGDSTAVRRFGEAVEALDFDHLLAHDHVLGSGRFERVDRASLVPKPARLHSDLARRIEREGVRPRSPAGGRFVFFGAGIDKTIDAWTRLRERVASNGRSVEALGGDFVALSGGDLGELTTEIEAWRAARTHVSVVTMGLGLTSVDAHIDYLTSVADLLNVV